MTKRKKIIIGVLSVVSLLLIVSVVSGSGSEKTASVENKQEESQAAPAQMVGLNEPARDGKFEFVVNGISCGKVSIGSEFFGKNSQGQFCELNLTVKNIGNEAQQFFSMNQFLYNASNQKYSADDQATMYTSPNADAWINQINPGNSITGTVVFDIPKDQVPTVAELHDSMYSGGVKIKL